jgi:hypothetical protein
MRFLTASAIVLALSLTAFQGSYAQSSSQNETPIYGSQLMTQQERTAYRSQMRQAKTAEERERLRLEHHRQMQARAQERGVTLPNEPPPAPRHGMGMGPGGGPGSGGGPMGPGGGPGGPRR